MANTPGNAPPSVNQLDAFMQARSPSAEIGKFNQDPQAAAVMQWLATPEAQEFLRRIVMEQGLMDQGPPPGAPGPGSGGAPLPLPGGPPGGPGPMDPGGRGGPSGPGHFRPHEQRPVPSPPLPPWAESPAPGVPGATRDPSDPASFGPQGDHPLTGVGRAIAGALGGPRPVFDPRTGRQLHVDPNTVRGAGRQSSGPGRAAAIQALIAEQAAGGRVGR